MTVIRGRLVLLPLLFLAVIWPSASVNAQYESLNPRNWFPLEVGNYWHYEWIEVGLFRGNEIVESSQSAVVGEDEWTMLSTIYCDTGPAFGCGIGEGPWYHMTDDFYLLNAQTPGIEADTVWPSVPMSVFRANKAVDDTTFKIRSFLGLSSLLVSIQPAATGGSAEDSTNLQLGVVDPNNIRSESYVYKIGRSSIDTEISYRLVGAIVNGLEFGDVGFLRRVLSVDEGAVSQATTPDIEVFPNPAGSCITVRVSSHRTGTFALVVHDLLGRVVLSRIVPVHSPGTIDLQIETSSLSGGSYLARWQGTPSFFLIVANR